MSANAVPTLRTVHRAVKAYGAKEWPRLLLSVSLLLGAAAATVLQPWPVKIVVDVVLGGEEAPAWLQPALDYLAQTGLFNGGPGRERCC